MYRDGRWLATMGVNGQTVVDVLDRQSGKSARRGIIALQLHAGHPMKVQFTEIRLRQPKNVGDLP